jgi:hypothetical protein
MGHASVFAETHAKQLKTRAVALQSDGGAGSCGEAHGDEKLGFGG